MVKRNTIKHAFMITAVLAVSLFLAACNPLENTSRSNTLLIVEKIMGKDSQGNSVNYLQSDVAIYDVATQTYSVQADSAKATLSAKLIDPTPTALASQYNDLIINRYVVTFTRSDGKNAPGTDVPYSFEGSLSVLLEAGGTAQDVSFIIVREAAKQEAPLVNLINAYPGDVLQVTAQIDFYGKDMTNHVVKATGYLTIFFANYADE
ncbi:MAG: hypothetical protein WCC06_13510 [Candidatus Aminicenantales bacterium]